MSDQYLINKKQDQIKSYNDQPPENNPLTQTVKTEDLGNVESEIKQDLQHEEHAAEEGSYDPLLAFLLRDGLDQPIEELEVKIDLPDGSSYTAKTDAYGAVHVPAPNSNKGEAQVSIRGLDGKMQPTCKIDLGRCSQAAVIRSPKVAKKVKAENHHKVKPSTAARKAETQAKAPENITKVQPSEKPWYEGNESLTKAWKWLQNLVHPSHETAPTSGGGKSPHDVLEAATPAGNPLRALAGPETGGAENLQLGRNNIYRDAVIKAGARVGLMPQAIAALIDAEAAKITETIPVVGSDGKPVLYKSGKKKGQPVTQRITEKWNAASYNAGSRAGGLTQFIVGTWLAHAMKDGYFVCEQCQAKKWVCKEKDKRGKDCLLFVLSDGKTVKDPWNHTGDANVQLCLKQRFDPEWAIMAAADYGKANLALLSTKGFKLSGLNDGEKAKLMYLMHHEGEGNGPLFIKNTLQTMPHGKYKSGSDRLRAIFAMQIGPAAANKNIQDNGGNPEKAYRVWLSRYINDKINVNKYFAKGDGMKIQKFDQLMKKIGGSSLV